MVNLLTLASFFLKIYNWEGTLVEYHRQKMHFLCVFRTFLSLCPNVSATPIGQMGLKMGWFPLGNDVCLIMKKAPSDSPIWQLKKRELLLQLSLLITKPIKLDLLNLHYGPHYKPHNRTQGCMIRENDITAPITLQNPSRTLLGTL